MQPKEIQKNIKQFLETARRKDTRCAWGGARGGASWEQRERRRERCACAGVVIKKDTKTGQTKFKIRSSRYLYTLKIADKKKAEKLAASLPPGITKKNIGSD